MTEVKSKFLGIFLTWELTVLYTCKIMTSSEAVLGEKREGKRDIVRSGEYFNEQRDDLRNLRSARNCELY